MSSKDTRSKLFKIGLTIGLIILLLLVGVQIFLSYYLDDLVENRLVNAVPEQTLNQYQLEVGELTLSVWNRKMELQDVSLHPSDSSSTAPKIDLDQFSVSGIQFLSYLSNGSVNIGDVQLTNPLVTFTENSPDSLQFLDRSAESSTNQKNNSIISVDRLMVDGGSVTIQTTDQNSSRAEIRDFDLTISGIRVDSTSRLNPPYVEFESVTTSTGSARYRFKNGLYTLETNQVGYSTGENIAFIDSLKLLPEYPKYEFARHIGHQKDRITLYVGRMQLEHPNLDLLQSGKLQAKKFSIDQANVDVFKSKLVPDDPDHPKTFPHIRFKNLNVAVSIDTVLIHQSEVSYSQHQPGIDRAGTVTFANINGTILNLSNDSTKIHEKPELILDVTSKVMGTATLDAHFEFPMNGNGEHIARGNLASMQVEALNPILEPVGLVRADTGNIHSLQFFMNLGSDTATGWTQLIYHDLKISVLDSEDANAGGSQRFKSFLANLLKVKSDNNEEPFRRGEVLKDREPTKSIFSYWWQSLATGLKDNIGL